MNQDTHQLRHARDRHQPRNHRWLKRSAIALLLLTSACQAQTQPNSSGTGTGDSSGLKVGSLMPVTGDLASYGGPMQDSANLLIETVNQCGGVLGQPIQIISEDSQTNPTSSASAMSKLVEADRVAAVVGPAASSETSAAVDIAVRNKIVQISPSATSPVFTERAANNEFDGFWFRTAPPDTFQGEALARLAQQRGYTNVAVIAINDDYGKGLVDAFIPAFKELGGTVVNESNPTFYSPTGSTFDSEVTTAFRNNPDAVLLVAFPETGSLVLRAAYEQGLLDGETPILLTDGMRDEGLADLVGRTADGSYIVSGMIGTATSAAGPAFDQFKSTYEGKHNRAPEVYTANTWDAAAVIVLAAEAAKSTDRVAIRDQVREVANAPGQEVTDVCEALELVRQGQDINYQGAGSTVEFDDQGDIVGSYDVWTITDEGAIQVEDTIDVGGES